MTVFPSIIISNSSTKFFSVSASRALVASSKRKILASFFKRLRAITTLYLSPPERKPPLSPTFVSYPSFNYLILSWIWHFLHTSTISLNVASGLLYLRLFIIESLNNVPVYGTIEICLRKLLNVIWDTS